MTQIDFYILGEQPSEQFVCKLVDKVYHLSHSIYIHTGSEQQALRLDEMLWTFWQGSFLPHEITSDKPTNPPASPILIGFGYNAQIHADVMINLSAEIPGFFSQFDRVVEFVHGDDALRQAARENYKFYKDRGYSINTHEIN